MGSGQCPALSQLGGLMRRWAHRARASHLEEGGHGETACVRVAMCPGLSPPRTGAPGTPGLERPLGARGHGDRTRWQGHLRPPPWSLDCPVPPHMWRGRGAFCLAGQAFLRVLRLTTARPQPLLGWGGAGQAGRRVRGGRTPTHGQPRCSGVEWPWQEEPPGVHASEESSGLQGAGSHRESVQETGPGVAGQEGEHGRDPPGAPGAASQPGPHAEEGRKRKTPQVSCTSRSLQSPHDWQL